MQPHPVLVTGGSGTLGRIVVRQLLDLGRSVRVLSRRPSRATAEWVIGDLTTGAGLDAAVRDVATIIHCASDPRRPRTDVTGSAKLLNAARQAEARHLVYISIVGIDRVPLGYYQAKLRVERMVEESGLPWTILRTTQFHDLLLLSLVALARLPVLPVPAGTSFQPIDAGEVAQRLVELADGPPRGRVPEMGGPEVRSASDLARVFLRASGRRRLVVPVPLPGAVARGFRQGGHLAHDGPSGRRSWEQFLAERFSRSDRHGGQ